LVSYFFVFVSVSYLLFRALLYSTGEKTSSGFLAVSCWLRVRLARADGPPLQRPGLPGVCALVPVRRRLIFSSAACAAHCLFGAPVTALPPRRQTPPPYITGAPRGGGRQVGSQPIASAARKVFASSLPLFSCRRLTSSQGSPPPTCITSE
jgi:hypothetical protein